MKERTGLSFGVRKMCEPYWGEDDDGNDGTPYGGLDLTSLTPRSLGVAKGVVVRQVYDGVDIDGPDAKRLKYNMPDMRGYDIQKYLSYKELELIAADPDDVDYDGQKMTILIILHHFIQLWVISYPQIAYYHNMTSIYSAHSR